MSATQSPLAAPAVRPAGVPVGKLRGRLGTAGLMLVVAVALIALAYVANKPTSVGTPGNVTAVELGGIPQGPAPIVGQAAPELQAATVDGSAFRLSDLKGKVVWLSFGATWCQPCRAEAADIEGAYETFKAKGVVVVEVFMTNDQPTIVDYADRVGLTFTKVPDPTSQLATNYRVLGIPTHFFIDRNGTLTQFKVGTLDRSTMDSIMNGLAN